MSDTPACTENLTTLSKHLAARGVEPGLASVLEALALGCKSIGHHVRRARIEDVVGAAGGQNVFGEIQEKLDVLSDEVLLQCLRDTPAAGVYASEEQEGPIVLRPASEGGRFAVLADPLDGSSNIDVAVSVGTIFSVLPNDRPDAESAEAVLQPGRNQVAAGYVVYGSSMVLVLATAAGVDMYTLDPVLGEFLLVKAGIEIPTEKKIYSINEAYTNDFDDGLKAYLEFAHGAGYGARYIGSMVADVHRTLLKGGVFIYPATAKAPQGKLRLMYEGNPMGFVIERAGGAASAGATPILETLPTHVHDRTQVILGSRIEVEHVTSRTHPA
ncbi:MAG: fructose-1,6-bisphosphatase [Deltaproteobacteria bacterium]|nr:fructose-1,6-bisphosphatase [Deltaproteobacteria bacterium]MBW2394830.1 fructose-1,6-bisphosphatase [Deltaproteobacteria bacterium]